MAISLNKIRPLYCFLATKQPSESFELLQLEPGTNSETEGKDPSLGPDLVFIKGGMKVSERISSSYLTAATLLIPL